MNFQILKRDMMKRKGVNAILFLFITLATVFLASSVNNILVVNSAVEYFIDYANVPDVNIIMKSEADIEKIDAWLDQQIQKGAIERYHYQALRTLSDKAVEVTANGNVKKLDTKGDSLFVGTIPKEFNKAFDESGKRFTLKSGEIALSGSMMDRNHLKIGDAFHLKMGDKTRTFKIAVKTKDAAFGNEMVGMSRFLVNERDFQEISEKTSGIGLYDIVAKEAFTFTQKLDNQGFTSIANTVTRDMYKKIYSFDMIMAGLLILIGVCLILIALLVLRFTLVFTIEEQYQEIGILKAIGLRDDAIKKLYLMKYLAIVMAGAVLGLGISVPVSSMMIDGINSNMVMESSSAHFGVSVLCAVFVVVLVLTFCYFCTRRLNKVSAITAIRGGDTGERYRKRRGLLLHKRKCMPVVLYLGSNDILSHLKRYTVLIITFCISFLLITIPLNTLNTMRSDEMVKKFLLNPDSSVYVRQIELESEGKYADVPALNRGMDRIQKELKEKGYDAKLHGEAIFFLQIKGIKDSHSMNLMSIQILDQDASYLQYSSGSAPKLENEIAFSEYIMKHEGWKVGDYVTVLVHGEARTMIISGTYSDYMQLGKSARVNPNMDLSQEIMFDYWTVMVDMKTDMTQAETAAKMNKLFPDYEWMTAQQLVDTNVGGIQDILEELLLPMTAMLCLVIMLITLLMEKLFITREKGEIAMMKSIGFRYSTIRSWQIIRMSLVVLSSMMISVPLSLLSNQFLLKPIFAIMGAEVQIQVNALQAYVLYPAVLLIGIILATILATRSIKHVDIREMNNLE